MRVHARFRRWYLPWLALLLPAACLSAAVLPTARAAAAELPNVILVMSDDQGWGDTGYNGHPHLKTPHLDQMAKDGLRLNRWYAQAPVCSPTRGSCLTGRHPYRYGIPTANSGHMKTEELTLAELLRKFGYTTGHFGKWHLGTLSKTVVESNRGGPRSAAHYAPPEDHGFDENFSTEAKVPTWDPMLKPRTAKGRTWWDPVSNERDAMPYGTHYWSRGQMVSDNLRGDDSRVIMDRAVPFIRQAVAVKKPFFTVIWFHAPHLPVVAGPEYARMYSQFGRHEQHYLGCITALDEQVGRLRAELADLGVADQTMLWYSADNGPEGNDSAPGRTGGLRGRKRSLFEGGVRVPGLLVWPQRVQAGSVTDVPCVTSDYLPTILDVIGAKAADDRPLDGVSLLPLIDGHVTQRPRPIGFQSGSQRTLVDNRYKLVARAGVGGKRATKKAKSKKEARAAGQSTRGKKPVESAADVNAAADSKYLLFDLVEDPAEKHDLSAAHPEIVRAMASTLESWLDSCKASGQGADYR